ncbi:MAG: hypothetical protein A4E49_03445 [Methanosaeta sp. PtaU1.Bin112]|nr:MAG: hypothetical protein A4E49_03445 [Methanosaeta sp. PtaU1.Bin112]
MKDPGVVALIRLQEKLAEPGINPLSVQEVLETHVSLNAPVLADAQEYDPIDDGLNGIVEACRIQLGIVPRNALCQILPPEGDVVQKGSVHPLVAPLLRQRLNIFVQRTIEHRLPGKEGGNLRPLLSILVVPEIEQARFGGFVILGGPRPAVVDGELLKIGENGDGKVGRPGIAPYLVGRINSRFDIYGWPLNLNEEFSLVKEAKAVVRILDLSFNIDRILLFDLSLIGPAFLLVVDIPPQRLKKGIDELRSQLSLIVLAGPVDILIPLEFFYKLDDLCGCGCH